jgi:hypothetical protein
VDTPTTPPPITTTRACDFIALSLEPLMTACSPP